MRMVSKACRVSVGVAACVLSVLTASCSPEFFANMFEERVGQVEVVFINNTPFRASFSYGSWDSLDRSPGPSTLQQLRLEGLTTSDLSELPCRRNIAIGTREFLDRVLANDGDDTDDFDPDAFVEVVNFSSADPDSDAAALPTAGTADGLEVRLGVDYSCADRLIFTFEQDPDAPGGFRIDFNVIIDVNPDEQ